MSLLFFFFLAVIWIYRRLSFHSESSSYVNSGPDFSKPTPRLPSDAVAAGGIGRDTGSHRRTHQDRREARCSGVLGSGLSGGDMTKAAALAQFLLQ